MTTEPPPSSTEIAPEAQPSKWPTVFGTISIIYAILGMLCSFAYAASSLFSEWLMSLGGMDIETPPALKWTAMLMAAPMLVLGIMMLVGGLRLLRRRSSGVTLLKVWAVLRLLLILIAIAVNIVLYPTNESFQQQMHEVQSQRLVEAGRDAPPPFDPEATWRKNMISLGVFSGLQAIYPFVLGLFLSRRRISEEVEEWT